MFARLFPINHTKIFTESYSGILKSLLLYPITAYVTPNLEEGLEGIYTNTKLRIIAPFDYEKRERYREQILNYSYPAEEPWLWQLALQKLLSDPKFYYLHSIVVAPIIEELIFRGLFMPFLNYALKAINLNSSYSVLLSSLAFGLMHKNGMKLGATCAGYVWGDITTQNDGSLWSSIAGHISQNAIGEIMHFYQKRM